MNGQQSAWDNESRAGEHVCTSSLVKIVWSVEMQTTIIVDEP